MFPLCAQMHSDWARLLHLFFFTQGAPGQPGGSSMFMPQGAVGVFELPTDWAVMQQQAHAEEPVIDT